MDFKSKERTYMKGTVKQNLQFFASHNDKEVVIEAEARREAAIKMILTSSYELRYASILRCVSQTFARWYKEFFHEECELWQKMGKDLEAVLDEFSEGSRTLRIVEDIGIYGGSSFEGYHMNSGFFPCASSFRTGNIHIGWCNTSDEGAAFQTSSWGDCRRALPIEWMLINPFGSLLLDKFLHPKLPKRCEYSVRNKDMIGIMTVHCGDMVDFKTSKLGSRSRYIVHTLCKLMGLKTKTEREYARCHQKREYPRHFPTCVLVSRQSTIDDGEQIVAHQSV